jgi:hypothetical protein
VADILGNSPDGKWSLARQSRINGLMQRVYIGTDQLVTEKKWVNSSGTFWARTKNSPASVMMSNR